MFDRQKSGELARGQIGPAPPDEPREQGNISRWGTRAAGGGVIPFSFGFPQVYIPGGAWIAAFPLP